MVVKLNTLRLNCASLNHASLNGVGERLRASAGGGGGEVIPPDVPVTYTLNASVENGSVNATVNGVAVTLPYVATAGDVVIVEVTANDGYEFEGWADGSTDNPRSITMTADVTLSATCVEQVVESKYIQFEDPAVEAVLMANNVSSDGIGITKEDAAAVTSISTWFRGNTEITSFDEFQYFIGVSETVNDAFNGASSLISIHLPSSLKKLATATFLSCIGLTKVTGLEYVESIGFSCFRACSSLGGAVNLPNLKSIAAGAFQGTNISSIQSLGDVSELPYVSDRGVFRDCISLTYVDNSVLQQLTNIGSQAFYGCTSLSFDELNLPNLTSLGQNAFRGVKIKKLNIEKVTSLPSGTTATQNYGDKSVLEELILPDTLTSLPGYALSEYSKVLEVNLNNVATLQQDALRNCGLTKAVLPNITTMNGNDFRGSPKLQIVDLGPNLTGSSWYTFYGCTSLNTLIMRATTPIGIDANALTNTAIAKGNGYIYVPDASVEAYRTATNWSQYQSRIKPLSEYTE